MNQLVNVIIEETQLERGVNNYLNEAFDELSECCGSIDEDSGDFLWLENEEGIKGFKTRREFFEFIIKVSQEAIKIDELDNEEEPVLRSC